MISNRKISHFDKRKVEKELKEQGFISATGLSLMSHENRTKLLEIKYFNYSPKKLKEIFEINLAFRAICLNVSGKNSYWYYVEDLKILP